MMTSRRPSGYSEILSPTEEQIAALLADKDSGELTRVILDRTTRGRVRAVWFRRARRAVEVKEETIDEEIAQLKSSIARPFVLAEPSALINADLNAKCLEENGRPPLNGDALKIDETRYLYVASKWMELYREQPDYLEQRLQAISKKMANVTSKDATDKMDRRIDIIQPAEALAGLDRKEIEAAVDRMMADTPPETRERPQEPRLVLGNSDPAVRRVPRPASPLRPSWPDPEKSIPSVPPKRPSGPSFAAILICAFLTFCWTIAIEVVWKLA